MAVTAAQIKLMHSTNRLGGAITTTESASGVTGNIFDTFSGAETLAGGTYYACVYVKNTNGTQAAQVVKMLIDSETDHDGVNVSLGLGVAGLNTEEPSIADENTAPAGVTFGDTDTTTSGSATADNELDLGTIPANQYQAVWVRVVIGASTTAKTGYTANFKINFDTAE